MKNILNFANKNKLIFFLAMATLGGAARCSSAPTTINPEKGQKLLREMRAAAGVAEWEGGTAAIEFEFGRPGKQNRHFWDKTRRLAAVSWQDGEKKIRVALRQADLTGKAWVDERPVTDPQQLKILLNEANKKHVNDAFWLNPLFHAGSPGAEVGATDKGELILHFRSGGVTPGDTYLLRPDNDQRLALLKMWVSILPVKGLEATFSGYEKTDTGVWIARRRELAMFTIEITGVKTYATYPPRGATDVFASLAE